MRLASLRCNACHVPYVWARAWAPANDRVEWRPRPDCACTESYGEPIDVAFIRNEYVADDLPGAAQEVST
jgi:hypothetical protein